MSKPGFILLLLILFGVVIVVALQYRHDPKSFTFGLPADYTQVTSSVSPALTASSSANITATPSAFQRHFITPTISVKIRK